MKKKENIQKVIIISIVCISVILLSILAYIRNLSKQNDVILGDVSSNLISNSESASTPIGKSIEEVDESEFENAVVVNNVTSNKTSTSNYIVNNIVENEENFKQSNENIDKDEAKSEEVEDSIDQEADDGIEFNIPVMGEIIREYAVDSLVYSNTLDEWITHNGIDIKADKTSVVTAAASGEVYAIKNDPRYGLTIIIDHKDGYRSIYSNLLTAEFVVEGESVEIGQTIGTVGNSSTFEVSDDYHLHFELLKDNEYVDPTIYMDFN